MDIKKNAENIIKSNKISINDNTYDNNTTKCCESTLKNNRYKSDIQKNAVEIEKSSLHNRSFKCLLCDFECNKQSNYEKHLNTVKHMKNTNVIQIEQKTQEYKCSCGKEYKTNSGLYKHKKNCIIYNSTNNNSNNIIYSIIDDNISEYENDNYNTSLSDNDNDNDDNNNDNDTLNNNIINIADKLNENIIISNQDDNKIINNETNKDEIINVLLKDHNEFKNLIIEVVKNNNEFQKQMMDLIKSTTINNNNITNNMNNMNNCNNQTFNLQFFLNETCKDAMNMSDFIESFDLKMSDLERLGEDGYVNTMSRLIINKVRELDVEKRPIHCSDARREIVYIKDDGVWVKDDEDKTKLRTVVNKVGSKNINILYKWQASHPDYWEPDSPDNNTYLKIMLEVMGGKNTRGNEDKVIKRIIKEVVIDKQQYINNKS
jgi:hypothetical protein